MKRFLPLIAILACFEAFGQAGVKWPNVVTEQRMKQYVDSSLKANVITTPPVVTPPVVVLDPCKQGPTIKGIAKIASTGMDVNFHGEKVENIEYQIWNEGITGSPIYIDSIRPSSSIIELRYKNKVLPNGTYTLILSGKNCSGTDRRKFTIKTDGSVIIPSPPPVTPSLGNVVSKQLNAPLPENMDIKLFWISGQYLISDMADSSPPAGYEYWYGVNAQIIKQSVPLRNYPWPANTPLSIWKAQSKVGLSTLAKWAAEDNGWFEKDAGRVFSHNDSYPFASFLFEPADRGYDTTRHVAHWMDRMPDMKLPLGHVWVVPIGPIDTPDFLISKGATHFSKYEAFGKPYWDKLLSEGRLYDEVPKTPEQLDLIDRGPAASKWVPENKRWPDVWNERFFGPYSSRQTEPGSYEMGFAAGQKYPTNFPIVIFENTEQDHALSSHWPIYKGFYDAFMPRMNDYWLPKGIRPLVAHNYFTTFSNGPFTLGFDSKENNKNILRIPYKDWPSQTGDLGYGRNLSKTTAVCFGIYLGAPDSGVEVAYRLIFAGEVAKAAGFDMIVFAQPFHEDRPNNLQRSRFPEGDMYFYGKKPWNPADAITYSFLAQTFGKGFIPFMAASKTPESFVYDRQWRGPGSLWFQPNSQATSISTGTREVPRRSYEVNPSSFPYWRKSNEPEVYQSGTAEYYIAEGVRLFCNTFGVTHGGERSFLRFRIDGGSWTEVRNAYMDDLVEAHFNKRGFVYAQRKGNQLSVFYLNSYADNNLHLLEYEYQGKIYSMKIHSSIIHPILLNL